MNLYRLVSALRRKAWLIATLAVVSAVFTGFYSISTAETVYRTETSLYIMKRSDSILSGQSINLQDIAISRQLISDYSHILLTRKVLEPAMEELAKQGVQAQGIENYLSVGLKPDSNILSIKVTWPNGIEATKIANAVSRSFSSEIGRLMNNNSVGILDEAKVSYPIVPNHTKKILTSFLAGAFVAVGIIYVRELFDNTIRSATDIESNMDLKIIGIIPEHNIS